MVIDDHLLYGETIASALSQKGFDMVAVTQETSECLDVLAREHVDVCLVDACLPDSDGVELVRLIAATAPSTATIMLSGSFEPDLPARALEAGAAGFVSKATTMDRLADAIERVRRGESVDERPRARGSLVASLARMITPKEREVLAHLLEGRDTAALAEDLGISYATARTHIQNLLTKLGVHSKLELVALVVEHRLFVSPLRRRPLAGAAVAGRP
jgi:DNA-binding NarL/FixJ family response regulator